MRLGRLILLASLAPLIGLPAVTAMLSAAANLPETRHRAQVSMAAPAQEFAAPAVSAERNPRQAVLALTVLAATPMVHSLWMVEQPASALVPSRCPRFLQLRC